MTKVEEVMNMIAYMRLQGILFLRLIYSGCEGTFRKDNQSSDCSCQVVSSDEPVVVLHFILKALLVRAGFSSSIETIMQGKSPKEKEDKECPLQTIIDEVEKCSFECEQGELEHHRGWVALKTFVSHHPELKAICNFKD